MLCQLLPSPIDLPESSAYTDFKGHYFSFFKELTFRSVSYRF